MSVIEVKAAKVLIPSSHGGGSLALSVKDDEELTTAGLKVRVLEKLQSRVESTFDPAEFVLGQLIVEDAGSAPDNVLPLNEDINVRKDLLSACDENGIIHLSLVHCGHSELKVVKKRYVCLETPVAGTYLSSEGQGLVTISKSFSEKTNWYLEEVGPNSMYITDYNGNYLSCMSTGQVSCGTRTDNSLWRIEAKDKAFQNKKNRLYLQVAPKKSEEESKEDAPSEELEVTDYVVSATEEKGDTTAFVLCFAFTEGKLQKKAVNGVKGMRPWQDRFFVLSRSKLAYWYSQAEKDEGVKPTTYNTSDIRQVCMNPDQPNRFNIVFTEGDDMELRAADANEARKWVRALNSQQGVKKVRKRRLSVVPAQALMSPRGPSSLRNSPFVGGLPALPEEGESTETPAPVVPSSPGVATNSLDEAVETDEPDIAKVAVATAFEGRFLLSDGKGSARGALPDLGSEWVVAPVTDTELSEMGLTVGPEERDNLRFLIDYQFRYLRRAGEGKSQQQKAKGRSVSDVDTVESKEAACLWVVLTRGDRKFLRVPSGISQPGQGQYLSVAGRSGTLKLSQAAPADTCSFRFIFTNISGYLVKKASTLINMYPYHKRFFVLQDETLRYYKNLLQFQKGDAPNKEFRMSSVARVAVSPKKLTRFNIEFKDGSKPMELTCESAEDCTKWVQALKCKGVQSYAKQRLSVVQHTVDEKQQERTIKVIQEKNRELAMASLDAEVEHQKAKANTVGGRFDTERASLAHQKDDFERLTSEYRRHCKKIETVPELLEAEVASRSGNASESQKQALFAHALKKVQLRGKFLSEAQQIHDKEQALQTIKKELGL